MVFVATHDLLQSSDSPQAEECSKANAIVTTSDWFNVDVCAALLKTMS